MGCRVLVVDDPGIARLVGAILAPHGHVVVPARDPSEALRLLRADHVDLVLLDLRWPDDGATFLAALPAPRPPVVLMVTFLAAHDEAEELARPAGVAGVLRKPFGVAELLRLVTGRCG